jgi:hypothetical protein
VLDTSPAAHALYAQRLAEATPSERVRLGVAHWVAAGSLQRSAIRRRNPEASDEEIAFLIAVSRFGPELARAAFRRM